MPTLRTKLTPFWYEPEFQGSDPVSFRLKPLTERDMIEVDAYSTESGGLTSRSHYEAGLRAITAVRGLTDEDGKELRWQFCSDLVNRHLIVQCGFRAIVEQRGGDWGVVVAKMQAELDQAEDDANDSSDHEDPEKN